MPAPRYIKLDKPRNFLLRDDFGNDETAPMVTPRRCEGGPGYFTVDDECSITGGVITIADTTDNKGIYGVATYPCITGLGAFWKLGESVGIYANHCWRTAANAIRGNVSANSSANRTWAGVNAYVPILAVANGTVWIIRRQAGAWFISNNELDFVDGVPDTAVMRISANRGSGYNTSLTGIGVVQLGAPWNTDFGVATEWKATATAGDTLSHEANGHVYCWWTAVTDEVFELSFRRTDDNNRWVVRCTQADSTVKLIQIEGGVETQRASVEQTWTNGTAYWIYAKAKANVLVTFVNGTWKSTYTNAFNNTATGAKVSHNVTNFSTWPVTLSGAALQEILRWTND